MTTLAVFKLLTTPLLIWAATRAARRWGPFVGGGIAGLPVISGPASVFITAEQGTAFSAAASYSALLGIGVTCFYCLAYAWTARRHGWPLCLLAAFAAFLIMGEAVRFLPHSLALACAVGAAGPPLILRLMPPMPEDQPSNRPRRAWLLPVQMALGGLAVWALTTASAVLGAAWSGLLMVFPVMVSVMTPFAHASGGPRAAMLTLRGLMAGFTGGSSFTICIACLLERLGPLPCYALATAASLVTSFAVSLICLRKTPRTEGVTGKEAGATAQ